MEKKYIVPISLFILAILLGTVWFVVQKDAQEPSVEPSSNTATTTDIFDMEPIVPEAKVSTEGWKTCRNEEYGYEFKFPAEWHIYGEDAKGDTDSEGKRGYVRDSEECNGVSIFLNEKKVVSKEKAPDILDTHLFLNITNPSDLPESKNAPTNVSELFADAINKGQYDYLLYVVGDIQALYKVDSFPNDQVPNELLRIFMFNNNKRYDISFRGRSGISIDAIFETILSTFHFLESENTPTEVGV